MSAAGHVSHMPTPATAQAERAHYIDFVKHAIFLDAMRHAFTPLPPYWPTRRARAYSGSSRHIMQMPQACSPPDAISRYSVTISFLLPFLTARLPTEYQGISASLPSYARVFHRLRLLHNAAQDVIF